MACCKCINKECFGHMRHLGIIAILLYCLGICMFIIGYITQQWRTLICHPTNNDTLSEVTMGHSGIYDACFPKRLLRLEVLKELQRSGAVVKTGGDLDSCEVFRGSTLDCQAMEDSPVYLLSVKFLLALALGIGVAIAGFLLKTKCMRNPKKPGRAVNGYLYIAMTVPGTLGIIGDIVYRAVQSWGTILDRPSLFFLTANLGWAFIVHLIGCAFMLVAAVVSLVIDRRTAANCPEVVEEQCGMLKMTEGTRHSTRSRSGGERTASTRSSTKSQRSQQGSSVKKSSGSTSTQ